MKHKINPQVDCVFKAILGAEKNKPVLLNFLNSMLEPKFPITTVEITNPYNEREFLTDKLTIVDIKAEDPNGCQYQIEIQIANYRYLSQRMLYTWSDIYSAQLNSGDAFTTLNPVISIWLLVDEIFSNSSVYHHHFQLFDQQQQRLLSEHCSIHVLELSKWQIQPTLTSTDHWLYFFKEAQHWTELPAELNTPTMRQAMSTLKQFSDKEREYHQYQARQNFLRDEASKQIEMAELEQRATESEQKATESEQKATESEQKVAKLEAQLRAAGIDPN